MPPLSVTSAIVVLAVGSAAPLAAQQARPLTEPPAFRIDQWTTEQGLPQNSVNAIAQTPDGHLWLGTFGGLVRFDGTSFRAVERTDTAGRHVDRILALAVAPDSALWVGTERGLLRLRGGAWARYTTADGLPDEAVTALHVDRTGTLWAGGARGGVARRVNGRFERVAEAGGRPLGHVIAIGEDRAGLVWVNAADRFVAFAAGAPVDPPPAGRGRGAEGFALGDAAGARWFTLADGMLWTAGDSVRVFAGPRVPGAPVMVEDPGGGFWLGTNNDGLFFFRPGAPEAAQVRRYPLPDGRRQFWVRTMLVGREGNVWIGTNADGLLRAKRNVFTTFTTGNGLSHDVMTAVTVDAAGIVWAATNCWGVNAIDRARGLVRVFKPRRPGDPAGDPCVFSLTESRPGTMWIGTWGGGLSRLRDGRMERMHALALPDSVILALFTDRDGTVWVGTDQEGLAAVRDDRVVATYTTADGLAHNSVRAIYQTRDGALWIGTLEGLSRFADGAFTTWTAADGLSAEHVRALYEDADGTLWVGTYGGGLNRFRDGVFTAITTGQGLADDVVSSILEDGAGRLWMSGNRGVFQAARADLVAVADGARGHLHTVLYGEPDGLLNAETNGGFQPAAWKDGAGRLWFPTVQGLAMVDPARVAIMDRAPPVRVDEVVVDGVGRSATDALVVGPGRPNLEFRYSGLSLSAPEHVTYRYRLEGFDDTWVEAGARRVAYYPRLPPGRYRFVVSAANRDGVWNEAGAALPLRIRAPFWRAWWFRLIGVTVLLGLIAGVLWRREANARRRRAAQDEFSRRLLESQEHERKRLAGELHDGLGQELLVVKNRALLALRDDALAPAAREQLEQITEVAGRSLEGVRSLAHNLTPYQLDHLGLTAALQTMIEATAEVTDTAISAEVDAVDGRLPVAGEINLYRIVQEALANVVRHAAARTARVRVRDAGDAIEVTVADDGRGFGVERDGRGDLTGGFGLSGITERVRILGGRIHAESAPGRGTRLEFSIPVARRPGEAG